MERRARDSRASIKGAGRELRPWLGWLFAWTVTLALLGGTILVAPSWRTVVAIGLMLAAYGVIQADWGAKRGPYAAVVAGVIVTRSLFLTDSEGLTRAWLGLENEYGDEHGPRLVLYDEKGQPRAALRLIDEQKERNVNVHDGPDAEVVPRGEGPDESERTEPALVMFGRGGRISLSLWSCGDHPALEAIGAGGHAGVQPGNIWALSHGGKLWSAPPEPPKDLFEE